MMVTKNTNNSDGRIVGAFEMVEFPEFFADKVRAKIDTGAYTGALHCSSIEERSDEQGKILFFTPFDSDQEIQRDDFVIKYVRSSNGKREKRYFITTKMRLQGKLHPITLSLADRSDMKVPVLIGRRFLRQYGFLVDPGQINSYPEQSRA